MEQNQIPWENFFRSDSSNMLEDALPYLPPNLKKVAAIYIKLTELLDFPSVESGTRFSICDRNVFGERHPHRRIISGIELGIVRDL